MRRKFIGLTETKADHAQRQARTPSQGATRARHQTPDPEVAASSQPPPAPHPGDLSPDAWPHSGGHVLRLGLPEKASLWGLPAGRVAVRQGSPCSSQERALVSGPNEHLHVHQGHASWRLGTCRAAPAARSSLGAGWRCSIFRSLVTEVLHSLGQAQPLSWSCPRTLEHFSCGR